MISEHDPLDEMVRYYQTHNLCVADHYAIDFETYYGNDLDVQTQGIRAYAEHTDIYRVAIFGPGLQYVGHPLQAPWFELSGTTWVSHNRTFDLAMWVALWGSRVPPAHYSVWECTADMAAYLGLPRSLAGAAEEAFDVKPDKTVRTQMKGKQWGDLDKDERDALDRYAYSDAKLCWELWAKYSKQWPHFERALSFETSLQAYRGMALDVAGLKEAIRIGRKRKTDLQKSFPWSETHKPMSPKGFVRACEERGIPVPSTTAAKSPVFQQWLEHHGDRAPWALQLQELRAVNRNLRVCEAILNSAVEE